MKVFIAMYLLDFCLISNFSCENYFNKFLGLSAVFFFLDQSLKRLGFSIASAGARHWILLNALCHEFWSFTLTKTVTHNNNENQCEFWVHNCGLDSVSEDQKQFLRWFWLECRELYSAPSPRLNSDFLLGFLSMKKQLICLIKISLVELLGHFWIALLILLLTTRGWIYQPFTGLYQTWLHFCNLYPIPTINACLIFDLDNVDLERMVAVQEKWI